jgi:hypothetical protein
MKPIIENDNLDVKMFKSYSFNNLVLDVHRYISNCLMIKIKNEYTLTKDYKKQPILVVSF